MTADFSNEDLANYLESIKDIGSVSVTKSGDCANLKWKIGWNTGGNKPALTVINYLISLYLNFINLNSIIFIYKIFRLIQVHYQLTD